MAPFKLRFSKLSKSRSKGSRSSSTECDEPLQQIQHCSISRPETPAIECNTISPINEIGIFPSSPPPSYEHVLQETRLKRTVSGGDEDEIVEIEDIEDRETSDQRTLSGICGEGCSDGDCLDDEDDDDDDDDDGGGGGGGGVCIGGGGRGSGDGSGGCCGVGGGRIETRGPEIIHKSSKELYRAVAKEWGLTCKMSDQCRCFDCQSHYFDSEYDKDEMDKSDGGLGAGTPMFIAEVMHGTACVLL